MVTNASGQTIAPPQVSEEEEARRRRQQSEEAQGWLSWLLGKVSSFGGIFMLGLLFMGAYFLMGTEKGQELVGNMANWITEKFPGLAGMAGKLGLLPEGVDEAVSQDPEAAARAMAIIREHGGNPLQGAKAALQPDTLYDLMIKEPKFIRDIAQNLPKGGSGDTETTQLAMTALRGIINDPAKLRTLLSPQHKANTYALLEALSPVPVAAGKLGAFIDATAFANGEVKPQFRDFLNSLLSGSDNDRMTAIINFARGNQGAVDALLAGVDTSKITDPDLKANIEGIKGMTPGARQAGLAIEANLRQQGTSFSEISSALTSVDALTGVLLNNEMRGKLLEPNIDHIGRYAAQQAKSAQGAEKTFYDFLGTAGQNGQGQQYAVNVAAMNTLFKELSNNPNNRGGHEQRTKQVISGMLGLMTGDTEASNRLNADNVSQFFHDPKNAAAFGNFFKHVNPGRLPNTRGHNLRGLVQALRDNWGNNAAGLVDILDDKESVKNLLDKMRSPEAGEPWVINEMWGITRFFATNSVTRTWVGVTSDMADNFSQLGNLQQALLNAGVSGANAPGGAAPAAPRPPQQPSRQ